MNQQKPVNGVVDLGVVRQRAIERANIKSPEYAINWAECTYLQRAYVYLDKAEELAHIFGHPMAPMQNAVVAAQMATAYATIAQTMLNMADHQIKPGALDEKLPMTKLAVQEEPTTTLTNDESPS